MADLTKKDLERAAHVIGILAVQGILGINNEDGGVNREHPDLQIYAEYINEVVETHASERTGDYTNLGFDLQNDNSGLGDTVRNGLLRLKQDPAAEYNTAYIKEDIAADNARDAARTHELSEMRMATKMQQIPAALGLSAGDINQDNLRVVAQAFDDVRANAPSMSFREFPMVADMVRDALSSQNPVSPDNIEVITTVLENGIGSFRATLDDPSSMTLVRDDLSPTGIAMIDAKGTEANAFLGGDSPGIPNDIDGIDYSFSITSALGGGKMEVSNVSFDDMSGPLGDAMQSIAAEVGVFNSNTQNDLTQEAQSLAEVLNLDMSSMHAHAYPDMLQNISDVLSESGYTEPAHELVENNPAIMEAASRYLSHAGADNIGYNPFHRFESSIVEVGRMEMAEILDADFNDPHHGWAYEQMMPHIETVLRYNGFTNPAEALAENQELVAAANSYLGTAGTDNLGSDPFDKLRDKVANFVSGELTASADEAPRRVFDDGAGAQTAQYMIRCEGREGFSVTNVADPSDKTQITGKFDSITGPQFEALGLDEAQIAFLHAMQPGGAMTADLSTNAIVGLEGRLDAAQQAYEDNKVEARIEAANALVGELNSDGSLQAQRVGNFTISLTDVDGHSVEVSQMHMFSALEANGFSGIIAGSIGNEIGSTVTVPSLLANAHEITTGGRIPASEAAQQDTVTIEIGNRIDGGSFEVEVPADALNLGPDQIDALIDRIQNTSLNPNNDAGAVHGGLSPEALAQIEAGMQGFDQEAAMAALEQKLEGDDASPKCGGYGELRTRCGSGAFTWNEDNLLPSPEIPESIEPPESCLTSDYNGIANEYNSAASVAELRADPADPGSSPAAIADAKPIAPEEPNVQMAGNFLSMNNLA